MAKNELKACVRRGRPSLNTGPSMNRTLRVDDQRWDCWRDAAEARGLVLADWIRQVCDDASAQQAVDHGQ